ASAGRAFLHVSGLGAAWVRRLAERSEMSLPAVSKHLKVPERAGLSARGRDAQSRASRLKPGQLKEVAGWLEHYRKFWEEGFDRLDNYLRELQSKEKKYGRKKESCQRNCPEPARHHADFRPNRQPRLSRLDPTDTQAAVAP